MIRMMLYVRGGLLFTLVTGIISFAPAPAFAQPPSFLNQTTCVSGQCLTNGALQTIAVNCAAGGSITGALASITDRNGPNVINATGTCNEFVNVVGHNRLTIQGGATLVQSMNVVNSRQLSLTNIVLDGGNGLALQDSGVTMTNVTVRNSLGSGITVSGGSNVAFSGPAPGNSITTNALDGVNVTTGSAVGITGTTTISNNGRVGISVHDGGHVTLTPLGSSSIDIGGNGDAGMLIGGQSGLIVNTPTTGLALVRIHDNHNNGVNVYTSAAEFYGNVTIDGNTVGSMNLAPAGVLVAASTGVFGAGVHVTGSGGPGVAAFAQGIILIGDAASPSGATIGGDTGGINLQYGSMVSSYGPNTISALSCDATSWTVGNLGTVGVNGCPNGAPSGTVGPIGPQGPMGPQGAPGQTGPRGPVGPSTTQSWSSTVSGALTKGVLAGILTPDVAIKVTRIQAVAQTAPVGCSANAVLVITDGSPSGTFIQTLTGAVTDSLPIGVNYAAGAPIYLVAAPPSGCSTRPADLNVLVQYAAQ